MWFGAYYMQFEWGLLCSESSVEEPPDPLLMRPCVSMRLKHLNKELYIQRTTVSLSTGFTPRRPNGTFKPVTGCVTGSNQSTRSDSLVWVKYAQYSCENCCGETSLWVFIGLSATFVSLSGTRPPCSFCSSTPDLMLEDLEGDSALLKSAERSCQYSDKQRSKDPSWQPGQKAWLSSTRKISPCFKLRRF